MPDCSCIESHEDVHKITSSLTDLPKQERTWIQCLHKKDDTWVPEAHDEDFEVDAKHCFVTGIGRKGVDEFDAEGFQPVKHGVENCFINSSEEDTVNIS